MVDVGLRQAESLYRRHHDRRTRRSSSETFGVKKIEKDESGQWYLNDKRIFLRGMRYISSLWISEATAKSYKADLDKMLDMTFNSIRIGSHVEKDMFYDMCDEMGFLVWQVFPLHYCYSDSDDVIERAAPMMRDMVYQLYNHASIGMWSVFKEPKIYALPDKPNNYGRLCQIMYEMARQSTRCAGCTPATTKKACRT